MNPILLLVSVAVLAGMVGCKPADPKLTVSSTAFTDGQSIPVKYTSQGADISPPLHWDGAPAATQSFVLFCDDPDAPGGTWSHWVVFNLPSATNSLPEAVPSSEDLPGGAHQGLNSFQKIGYGGPAPPAGPAHRYYFKVYALDTILSVQARPDESVVLQAMQGHILAQGQLMGRYQRQ